MGVHLLKKQHSWASAASGGGSSSSGGGSSSSGMPPKGCMAVRVVGPSATGAEGQEERFVVPVGYLKHPLFVALLKAAEEEYGFAQKGAITIPCGVDHFRRVLQGIIVHKHHQHHQQGQGGSNHHFHIAGCFRA